MKPMRGFTVLELCVVLALIGISVGFVVVRIDFGGERQQLHREARQLGNIISSYRDRAVTEQCIYALVLPADQYRIVKPSERSLEVVAAETLKHQQFQYSKVIQVRQGNAELPAPLVLYFDPRGIVPDTTIVLSTQSGEAKAALSIHPLTNEITYEER